MKTEKAKAAPAMVIDNKNAMKNAVSAANKLLKGIDNETASVRKLLDVNNKKIEKVAQSVENLSRIIAAVSNISMEKPVDKPTVKAAPKAAANVTGKPEKEKKPEKSNKVDKNKASKAAKLASPKEERPTLKSVIDSILIKSPAGLRASAIYSEATNFHGNWSRQSLYNALKDTSRYSRASMGGDVVYKYNAKTAVSEEEADKIINKIETTVSVSKVV